MLYGHMQIHAEIYIYMLDTYRRNDKDRRNDKIQEDFFNKIYVPLTLLQGFKKGYSRSACERELEIEHNCNILTLKLWPSALCLSRSPGLLNQRPRAHSARWWLFYCILSATSVVPKLHCYIIIQHPHDRQLDLWNRMFNLHQAEITVVQFTGHSLPVH